MNGMKRQYDKHPGYRHHIALRAILVHQIGVLPLYLLVRGWMEDSYQLGSRLDKASSEVGLDVARKKWLHWQPLHKQGRRDLGRLLAAKELSRGRPSVLILLLILQTLCILLLPSSQRSTIPPFLFGLALQTSSFSYQFITSSHINSSSKVYRSISSQRDPS